MEQAIWQEYQDDGVLVWGINFHEPPEVVEAFVENFGLTFPILLDPDGIVYHRYVQYGGCNSPFPLDYIVDPDGLIAYRACEYFPDSMSAVISEILQDGGDPAPPHRDHLPAGGAAPLGLRLESVSPNPLRGGGAIHFSLPSPSDVLVDVLDVAGRRVRRVHSGPHAPGRHVVPWDGRDTSGRSLPGGVYLLRVATAEEEAARKVLLIR